MGADSGVAIIGESTLGAFLEDVLYQFSNQVIISS